MNLELLGDSVLISDAYKQREAIAHLDGALWRPLAKAYVVDASPANVASLAAMCPLPPELQALLPRVEQRIVADDGPWITYDATMGTGRDRGKAPWEHQRDAVGTMWELLVNGRGGGALLMEQRTGKARISIELFARMARAGLVRRVLVVSLSTPCGDYAAQVAEYLDGAADTAVLFGTPAKRVKLLAELSGPVQVAIINYESAWRLKRELIAWGPDLVIADEMHRIKSPTSKQSKGIQAIGDAARYRLGMTGTATPNSPLDIHSEYRFCDRTVFGDSYYVTKAVYGIESTIKGAGGVDKTYVGKGGVERKVKVVVGYRRLDELQAKMHSIAFVRRMSECVDLPPEAHIIVPVPLGAKAARAYRELERESVAEWEGGETSADNVLTRKLRLQQITSGMVPRDDGETEVVGTEKIDAFLDTVSGILEDGQKVVVYARFRHEVQGAVAALARGGVGVVELSGRIPKADRFPLAVTPFQRDKSVRAIVCQIQCGGIGIDLSAADTEVFISKSHNFADYDQARARIVHGDKTNPLTYYHLVAPGTVDEEIEEGRELKCNLSMLLLNRRGNPFR